MNKKQEEKNEEIKDNEEFKDLENQLKRALADYQNLEKRIAQEKGEWIRSANKNLILNLLPGLDSLLLAEKHTKDEGVRLAIKHFLEVLEIDGVKKIETVGLDFNPNLMEAVATLEGEEGKVIEETRSGFTISGQVLRAAQVIVGAGKNNS
jgi:molecular chaperone GrpE